MYPSNTPPRTAVPAGDSLSRQVEVALTNCATAINTGHPAYPDDDAYAWAQDHLAEVSAEISRVGAQTRNPREVALKLAVADPTHGHLIARAGRRAIAVDHLITLRRSGYQLPTLYTASIESTQRGVIWRHLCTPWALVLTGYTSQMAAELVANTQTVVSGREWCARVWRGGWVDTTRRAPAAEVCR